LLVLLDDPAGNPVEKRRLLRPGVAAGGRRGNQQKKGKGLLHVIPPSVNQTGGAVAARRQNFQLKLAAMNSRPVLR
jgi:hypothetical protein